MGIHKENGKLDMDEIKSMLKKLATILMLDGLKETDSEKITLSNSLGIVIATLDLGPSYYLSLIKALGPQSKMIAEEIEKGNPRLSDLHAVQPGELFDENGSVDRSTLIDIMLKKDINLEEVLKGTGATTSDNIVFEPKK